MRRLSGVFGAVACCLAPILVPCELQAQKLWPVDFLLLPQIQNVHRQFANPSGTTGADELTLKGIEANLIGSGAGVGIGGRYLSATALGNHEFRNMDGFLFIGDRLFRLEVAYSSRTYLPLDTTLQFLRGGFAGTVHLGTSGVSVRMRAGYYVPLKRLPDKGGPEGWDGETAVSYTWDRYPIFGQLGYRIDRFRAARFDEDMSALTLGVGVWFWGK